ncbi:PLD nuclease N-terminal domain-containing protein [Plantibacter sp. YIM 135249]|uniref:PLD nuclease N-terminal domain-containing protein n=1 Tax=Plantibacter sp. YIM 135249 TaxID=3423918 RepID=UPI003D3419E7
MVRLLIGLAVAAVVFIVYSVVDCATMPRERVRGISKPSWIIAILLLPVIGAALWFIIGRVRAPKAPPRGKAPDDDPDFLRKLDRDRAQTKRIHDLEDELKRLDDDNASPSTDGRPSAGGTGSTGTGAAGPGSHGNGASKPKHPDDTEHTDHPDDGPGRKPPGTPSAS